MKIPTFLLAALFCLNAFSARVEVEIEGMTCGMCVDSITKELKTTEKVENISVSLERKNARFEEIKGKKVSDGEIKAAIKKAGYEATRITRK